MTISNKLPVLELISAQMRTVLAKSAELAPGAYDTAGGFESMRANYILERHYWNEGGPVMEETRDCVIVTQAGNVPLRFHVPTSSNSQPKSIIVYLHGGGWVLGNLDTHDRIMRLLADFTGSVVVGVDYALSPEAKFPLAVHQGAEVVRHLHHHGAQYNLNPDRIGLVGDSAGATLCLAAYLYLRDEVDGAGYIRGLGLYYGLYGLRDSTSIRLLGGEWDGLTEADLAYYLDCYLSEPEDARSPYVDCLNADLSRVPPTFIAAAEFDPLRDDSAALAAMLGRHDQIHRHVTYPGVLHAFLHNSRHLPQAMDAIRDGAAYLRDALDQPLPLNQTY
ncbi:MAG: acetyl esterase [Propionibacteriaceae bacterium]|nr:acetyl esterase [Propionibacteriaceae bacterium]